MPSLTWFCILLSKCLASHQCESLHTHTQGGGCCCCCCCWGCFLAAFPHLPIWVSAVNFINVSYRSCEQVADFTPALTSSATGQISLNLCIHRCIFGGHLDCHNITVASLFCIFLFCFHAWHLLPKVLVHPLLASSIAFSVMEEVAAALASIHSCSWSYCMRSNTTTVGKSWILQCDVGLLAASVRYFPSAWITERNKLPFSVIWFGKFWTVFGGWTP